MPVHASRSPDATWNSSTTLPLVSRTPPSCCPLSSADVEAPGRLAKAALGELGVVDILVNNAAAAARLPTVDLDAATIDTLLAVNVRAPLLLIAGLLPSMIERGRGSIVNLSSVSGIVGTPRRAAYAASKGAVDAFTRSLAMELGPAGIRVNAVAPGVVDTALWARNKAIPGVVEQIEAQTPLAALGNAGRHRPRGGVPCVGRSALRDRRDDLRRRRHGPHPGPLRG